MTDETDWDELIAIKAGAPLPELAAAGLLPLWRCRLQAYLEPLREAEIRSVILDYDGTVYDGGQRDEAWADEEMVTLLCGLLDQGLHLGFASGRGLSLRDALRHCFPERYWARIFCAYQDGAETGPLANDNLPTPYSPELENPRLAETRRELTDIFAGWPDAPSMRPENQLLGVYGQTNETEQGGRIFAACCQIALPLGLKVFHGGRMTDIAPEHVSKGALRQALPAPCLAIGDAGAWPGNDCELLAHPMSISVGSVSCDPASCWRLTRETGVTATKAILRHLRPCGGAAAPNLNGQSLKWTGYDR